MDPSLLNLIITTIISMAQTEAQILEEISRLSGAINRHKSATQQAQRGYRGGRPYVPPSYRKPYTKSDASADPPQEVVLGGQVFQSGPGGKSLVRKGAPAISRPTVSPTATSSTSSISSTSTAAPAPTYPTSAYLSTYPVPQPPGYVHAGKNKLIAANLINKAKPRPPPPAVLAAKRARLAKMSAILNNVQAHRNKPAFGQPKMTLKRRKVVEKPCKYWTRTGICQNGNTCPYQHDPNKTAICPRFVTGDCPETALTCPLSHDPTPERMPLCVHFQNAGRCRLGTACPYPHVFLGSQSPKTGVCRDFAVLGYCERGIDCERNHVRECPDFAERGVCGTQGCKLPHVIRASRGKMDQAAEKADVERAKVESKVEDQKQGQKQRLGDEFVSLTFEESEDESQGEEGEAMEGEEMGEEGEDVEHDVAQVEDIQVDEDEQDVDVLLSEGDDHEIHVM